MGLGLLKSYARRCTCTGDGAQDSGPLSSGADTGMSRACAMQPSTEELRFLLKWAFGDVEASRSKVAAFSLLKAAIARRLVVPEVYALMERVQELMIKSHVRPLSCP